MLPGSGKTSCGIASKVEPSAGDACGACATCGCKLEATLTGSTSSCGIASKVELSAGDVCGACASCGGKLGAVLTGSGCATKCDEELCRIFWS
eukprot:CAMPEP_0169136134 /NCGR_PEP_ID=MMETSP1015-20121227/40807_1 /TAXON_ID=342587 /ORGANISM="Karlodinium micrum, Strain CCMP2283" /LENGTH=92 /DNA_ID=CAMNT_0009200819 /DNA_START=968 /DNA_END=1246 /DNA_ORIENTATION=+